MKHGRPHRTASAWEEAAIDHNDRSCGEEQWNQRKPKKAKVEQHRTTKHHGLLPLHSDWTAVRVSAVERGWARMVSRCLPWEMEQPIRLQLLLQRPSQQVLRR
jgi:hypothetical protein